MAIITKSKLSQIVSSTVRNSEKADILKEARRYSRTLYTTSVFLSHSHHDREYVEDVVVFLRKMGVDVYIDWMDDTMPKETSGETATLLKQKIKENDKFIFLATNKSIESKWCNWEIGFGDAQKYLNKIALFPLKEDNLDWNGNEYLKIYPHIKETGIFASFLEFRFRYVVIFPNGNEMSLQEWLEQ